MVRVIPTLQSMAEVYRLPRDGGPNSERFRAYIALTRAHERDGFPAYNPMTGPAALQTVEELLAIDAEGVALNAATSTLATLELPGPVELSVIVATPGLWTNRLTTEVEHRLRPERGTRSIVQMWTGEGAAPGDVWREAVAETVRIAWTQVHGPADTVGRALLREGLALAMCGSPVEDLSDVDAAAVDDALLILGESRSQGDIFAMAYGDPLAEALGLARVGLPDRAGCRLGALLAARALNSCKPSTVIREWSSPRELHGLV